MHICKPDPFRDEREMITHDFIRDVRINQNRDGYRFSVDALLLASFVKLPRVKKVADIGAGSGIIGLLLARQYPKAEVALIELQESLAKRAEENIALNGFGSRVRVIRADIKAINERIFEIHTLQSVMGRRHYMLNNPSDEYGTMVDSFDLVVSNPPFRRTKTGLLSLGDERAVARHEIKLPLTELARAGSLLLRHHGRFCIIHLPERLADIVRALNSHAMEPKRLRFVHSYHSSEAKMLLLEAVKGGRGGMKIERPLVIYNGDGSYTEEMKEYYSCEGIEPTR